MLYSTTALAHECVLDKEPTTSMRAGEYIGR